MYLILPPVWDVLGSRDTIGGKGEPMLTRSQEAKFRVHATNLILTFCDAPSHILLCLSRERSSRRN
jgi:hypothetical protein